MDEIVICKTCKQEIRFGELKTVWIEPISFQHFVCPCCNKSDFDVSHLEPGKETA